MNAKKASLFQLIRKNSYKEANPGEQFTLASGKKAKYYFDIKQTILDPVALTLVADVIWDTLEEKANIGDFDGVGGLTMGADPITYAFVQKALSKNRTLYPLIVRKNIKQHGTQKKIEGFVHKCKTVLSFEDVVTTGGSLLKAITAFRQADLVADFALCVVDRLEGGRELLKKENVELIPLFDLNDFRTK